MALSPPNRIVIDFLEGVTLRADAIAYARGFISSHFDVPEQSGYYVVPYKDGYAFEVQEGGSRLAYLPGILSTIEDSPNATVSVRSGSRVLQVSKGARDSFNSVLLPEELSSYLENIIEPDEKAPPLIPYQIDNVVWLFAGLMTIGFGVLILLFALGFFLLIPKPVKAPPSTGTPVAKLPISQWSQMVEKLDGTNYIAQMKFENGNWTFDIQPNDKTMQTAPAAPTISAGQSPVMIMSPDGTLSPKLNTVAPVPLPPVIMTSPAKPGAPNPSPTTGIP